MEPNLFPASGEDRDQFKIYNDRHIQTLIDDYMETERLLDQDKTTEKPILHEIIRNEKRIL